MEIKTKYSIGDIVYICTDYKLRKCRVEEVNVTIDGDSAMSESYLVKDVRIGSTFRMDVSKLFDTVDKLVESFNL